MAGKRRPNDNTESVDNYLKAIFTLGGADEGRVSPKLLAQRLGVAPASVTNMLQKLAGAAEPLVAYERHRGVQLSPAGRRRALEIVRHHRLLETFLYEVLDYPLEEVHDEAERLEHFISERFEERIAAKLGHPVHDPHGHSIPTMSGEMAPHTSVALNEIARDGLFVVDSVSDRDAGRLRLIEACGLTPGVTLKVKKTARAGYSVSLGESSKPFNVSQEVAADVRLRRGSSDAMKILVIGAGGREHALVWSLRRSPRVTEIVCAPGNGGIAALARCEPLDVGDVPATLALAAREQPGLVVIGPEVPLAAGVVDALELAGVRAFGPTRTAAMLETSKAFAKNFMQRHGIATAQYAVCHTLAQVDDALPAFAERVVVKADGLAAGKGVVLCETHGDARAASDEMFSGHLLGTPVASLVLEEMLEGPEVSFFALCDGLRAVALAAAQDHKRIGEGDTGPNTGGMGAYSTDTHVPPDVAAAMLAVAQTVVDGMRAEGTPFAGVLFTGFMLTSAGPRVLEFNTRFGDPETEAILPRLDTDLLDLLEACVDCRLHEVEVKLKAGASACVIAASAGYPGKYKTGFLIDGEESVPDDVLVFHSGTALVENGRCITSGGRVLAITALGDDLNDALIKVYGALEEIVFPGMYFRRDIGWRAL